MTNTGSVFIAQKPHFGAALRRCVQCLLVCALSNGMAQAQTEEFPQRVDGDIGLGSYYTRSIIHSKNAHASVLPYGNFDLGRMFVRIDTMGIKTMKLGYGYLEIAGRASLDGFSADAVRLHGLNKRRSSLPIGLGTLQITPIGALFVNAFHDINKSHGDLFEVIYVTELDTPQLTFYPLAGAEYQSSAYVRYYYGISAQEATTSQYATYQPTGAFNPMLGLMIDAKLTEEYHLNFYLRRKWLGQSIQSSPIVSRSSMDTGFVALSYRFK